MTILASLMRQQGLLNSTNMMNPFAYMYYRIAVLYKKWGEKDAEIPATIIISLFQTGNALAILPFLINIRLNNWLALAVYISLCLMLFSLFLQ